MAAPFCTGCGATIADGTRFCVKCGQPVGHAAPPPPPAFRSSPPSSSTVPPPPPPPTISQAAQYQAAQDPIGLYPPPVKKGAGAGVWIGLFGILLLIAGAGLWFYTTRIRAAQGASAIQVAGTPSPPPAAPADPAPAPAPSPTPEVIPPNPDFAKKKEAKKEEAPPEPSPKSPKQATERPIQVQAPPPRPQPPSPEPAAGPAPPVKPANPTSGNLHATVEVAQYGEVVFENLPGGRLKFTFDHSAWQPTIHRQANGTQTLIMRSLKQGIQRTCDVRWEIAQ